MPARALLISSVHGSLAFLRSTCKPGSTGMLASKATTSLASSIGIFIKPTALSTKLTIRNSLTHLPDHPPTRPLPFAMAANNKSRTVQRVKPSSQAPMRCLFVLAVRFKSCCGCAAAQTLETICAVVGPTPKPLPRTLGDPVKKDRQSISAPCRKGIREGCSSESVLFKMSCRGLEW